MTNEERRLALAKARRKALEWAEHTEEHECDQSIQLANMWANVAGAMKTGGALEADGVIPDPTDIVLTR